MAQGLDIEVKHHEVKYASWRINDNGFVAEVFLDENSDTVDFVMSRSGFETLLKRAGFERVEDGD